MTKALRNPCWSATIRGLSTKEQPRFLDDPEKAGRRAHEPRTLRCTSLAWSRELRGASGRYVWGWMVANCGHWDAGVSGSRTGEQIEAKLAPIEGQENVTNRALLLWLCQGFAQVCFGGGREDFQRPCRSQKGVRGAGCDPKRRSRTLPITKAHDFESRDPTEATKFLSKKLLM